MKISTLIALAALAAMSCSSEQRYSNATAGGPGVVPGAGLGGDLVLRSYEVPNDGAGQMRSVLKDMMWFGSGGQDNKGQYVGRVEVGPDGRLLVLASPGVHEGVKALLDQMAKAPPKGRSTIELNYWFVIGKPGATKEARPANLAEVAPALAEIEKTDGPQEFQLEEKLVVRALTGEFAKAEGRDWQIGQTASQAGNGSVSVDVRLSTHGPQRIDTRLKLSPGQTAVLGSSGAGNKGNGDTGSLYYLVRAAIHDGQGN